MTAYYNEIDPYAAQWLRNLIQAGHIAPGDVDERSIVDVRADELRGYTQCHFFAGIGGWSVALRLAGWSDARPVWTGSCPCQPFSSAGAGKAGDDGRHLWPAWFPLIAECGPPVVFGEQVEAAIGWGWLDAVFADLEGEGYACGTAILPACGVGAPHIRQRLWFVGHADSGDAAQEFAGHDVVGEQRAPIRRRPIKQPRLGAASRDGGGSGPEGVTRRSHGADARSVGVGELGHPDQPRPQGRWIHRDGADERPLGPAGMASDLADAAGRGQREFGDAAQPRRGGYDDGSFFAGRMGDADSERENPVGRISTGSRIDRARSPLNGFWADTEWIACTDGKARPVGPGSFPLGHGIHRRASKLRAYGNAIVPQVAAEFIRAAS